MIFQGDEAASLAYFKFFRKFSSGPEPYLLDKGYEPGMPAFLDSKLSSTRWDYYSMDDTSTYSFYFVNRIWNVNYSK